jgi:magnesium transporter
MIRTIVVNKQGDLKINIPLDTLLSNEYLWYWIDFDQPDEKENLKLRDSLHFHPLAIEDCIYRLQRPKLDYYEDHTFLVTHSVNPITLAKEELNLFVGQNFIVSYHHSQLDEVNTIWRCFHDNVKIDEWDTYKILHRIIDKLVDQYFPIAYRIEDTLNTIDENSQNESMEVLLDNLFKARHNLLTLRQSVSPMRDLVYRMLNSHRLPGVINNREYFLDIYDHLLKLSEMIEANREITADIRDSYLSYNSHQTNRIMKILTVFTTIFMPLTFIAGVYGMNFSNMPELSWKYGYFGAILFMAIIGFGMYWIFKKKGWFN